MENTHKSITLLAFLLLASTTTGECFPSNEEGKWTKAWPCEIHPQQNSTSEQTSNQDYSTTFVYATSHVWFPGNGDKYYGAEATLDVYGLALGLNQSSQAGIWIANKGDGQPSSMNGIQIGWHISPGVYNDSQTHFFVDWTSAGADKHCLNMLCPGFKKTSSIITPGDVINPVSAINGNKQYVTLKLFKDKSTGDWHVHYGFNGDAKPVGFLPKSFLTGMIDKPVEINFGGLVYHSKPQPSPPMGNGYLATSGAATTFSSLKLISEDGNGHPVTTNLPIRMTRPSCYPMSWMDSKGGFSYGGPGCAD